MTKDELLAYAKERGDHPANAAMSKDEIRESIDERLMAYAAVEELQGLLRIPTPTAAADGRDGTLLGGGGNGDRLGARLHRGRPRPRIRRLHSSSRSTSNGPSNTGGSPTVPFGVVGVGAESEPIVAARNSWYRHHLKLAPLREHVGHCVTLAETMEDIADALAPVTAEVDGLQVYPFLNSNPTPPALDIYPGAPFQTGAGFGVGQSQVWFTIRARVSHSRPGIRDAAAAADDGPQRPRHRRSRDRRHRRGHPGRRVASSASTSRTAPRNGRLLGCEWRVSVFL